jgi:hypothetical protein
LWLTIVSVLLIPVIALGVFYFKYRVQMAEDEANLQKLLQTKPDSEPVLPKLSRTERDHLLDGAFSEVRDVASIPPEVRKNFLTFVQAEKFEMANPGEEFQVSDYVDKPGLPWQRLILAGRSSDKFFLHYEHGGIALSFHLVVFDMKNAGSILWAGYVPKSQKLDALRKAPSEEMKNHTYQ